MRQFPALKCRFMVLLATLLLAGSSAYAKEWNALDYGVDPSGKTDCTAALQKVLDECSASGGGIVNLPTGQYRFDGNLVLSFGAILQGTFRNPNTYEPGEAPLTFSGTELLVYGGRGSNDGPAFIRLAAKMATLRGLLIRYPEARFDAVPPAPYPPTVFVNQWETTVEDVCLLNSYEAIRVQNAGRHLIRNVHGYPTWRGMVVDYIQDIGRIENVHFSPMGFLFDPKGPYMKWVFENGIAFEFAHSDWQYCLNTFCFGYKVGYRFTESKTGRTNGNFLGIAADCCQRPVLVEQASDAGILITNGEFVGQWDTKSSIGVDVLESCNGVVQLSNCCFFGPYDRNVRVAARDARVSFTGCNFSEWDKDGDDSESIQLDAGRAIIQGCFFRESRAHIVVGAGVRAATIIGNQAEGGIHIRNQAGARLMESTNETSNIVWPEQASAHYRIDIGSPGDSRYLREWGSSGKAEEWPNEPKGMRRWSKPGSSMDLPVLPKTTYEVKMDLYIPEEAANSANGVFLGTTQLVAFTTPGVREVTFALPPQDAPSVTLTMKGDTLPPQSPHPWFRLLVAARSITLRAAGSGSACFNANTGDSNTDSVIAGSKH